VSLTTAIQEPAEACVVAPFGGGSEPVKVRSGGSLKEHDPDGYAQTVHRFQKAGHYIVRVEGEGVDGMKAVGHLQVRVAEKGAAAP